MGLREETSLRVLPTQPVPERPGAGDALSVRT